MRDRDSTIHLIAVVVGALQLTWLVAIAYGVVLIAR